MKKRASSPEHKHIIDMALGEKREKQNTRLADVTLEEMQKKNETRKMLKKLADWNVDVEDFKKNAKL